MRLRLASNYAKQFFKISPDGERLFVYGLPWSRPYVIPNLATEKRLFKKQLWLARLMIGFLVLGQPVLILAYPQIVTEFSWFVAYLFGAMLFFWIVNVIVVQGDIRNLKRTDTKLSFNIYLQNASKRHSKKRLMLGFLASIAFVVVSILLLFADSPVFISVIGILFFGLCSVVWGYLLNFKVNVHQDRESRNEKQSSQAEY